ncbi:MAG TPA: hypothetical protein VGL72_06120, partial [Bryobacteraceae bacterium]
MPSNSAPRPKALKAVILAAGSDATSDQGRSIMLHPLGERSILQCVVQNALDLVSPDDIYVVVGYRKDDIRAHLGPDYHYVTQDQPL